MAASAGCTGVAVGDVMAVRPAVVVVVACFNVLRIDGLSGGEETGPGGLLLLLLLLILVGRAPSRWVPLVVCVLSLAGVPPAASVVGRCSGCLLLLGPLERLRRRLDHHLLLACREC